MSPHTKNVSVKEWNSLVRELRDVKKWIRQLRIDDNVISDRVDLLFQTLQPRGLTLPSSESERKK